MKTVSFRLKPGELRFIERLSLQRSLEKSAALRELIDYGWVYYILKLYREGNLSIGKAANELKISISEFISLLAELGIQSPITYENYLEGEKNIGDYF